MNPNPGFKKQLAAFEDILRARGHYDTPIIEEIAEDINKENGDSISKDNKDTQVNGHVNGDTQELNGEHCDMNNNSCDVNNNGCDVNRKDNAVNGTKNEELTTNCHAVVQENSQ